TARAFEERPTDAPVPPGLHGLVGLAVAVTRDPRSVTPARVAAAAAGVPPAEYLDAVGVMLAFNFITRVANALGVVPDIPGWARRGGRAWRTRAGSWPSAGWCSARSARRSSTVRSRAGSPGTAGRPRPAARAD